MATGIGRSSDVAGKGPGDSSRSNHARFLVPNTVQQRVSLRQRHESRVSKSKRVRERNATRLYRLGRDEY